MAVWQPTPRDAQYVAAMLDIKALHSGAACVPVGNWLVKQAKRTWPRFAGYRFFKKTNSKRSFVLVSYHHPAQLCWEWSIWIDFFKPSSFKRRAIIGAGFKDYWFRIPYLFGITLHRQTYGWMLSFAAEHRLEAIASTVHRAEAA